MFGIFLKIELWIVRLIVGVGGGVLIVVAGYFLDIRHIEISLDNKLQEIVSLEGMIKKLKQESIKKQSYDSRQSSDVLNNTAINIISFIEHSIFETGVRLKLLESIVGSEKVSSSLFAIRIELDGGYVDLLSFLNKIFQSSYLVAVDELSLERRAINSSKELKMRLLLAVYRGEGMEDGFGKDCLIPDLASNARDVFDRDGISRGLHLWSSDELRLVGVIRKGRVVFGVIADPVGYIYQVRVGDMVGINQSKITIIDRCKITMVDRNDNIFRGGKCD